MVGVGGSLEAKVDGCQALFSKNFCQDQRFFIFSLPFALQGASLNA
jgi:hypothetical protein